MVGMAGFEPTTPAPPERCATKLRHIPSVLVVLARRVHVPCTTPSLLRRPSRPLLSSAALARMRSAVVMAEATVADRTLCQRPIGVNARASAW